MKTCYWACGVLRYLFHAVDTGAHTPPLRFQKQGVKIG